MLPTPEQPPKIKKHRHSGIFISRKRKENIRNLRRQAGPPSGATATLSRSDCTGRVALAEPQGNSFPRAVSPERVKESPQTAVIPEFPAPRAAAKTLTPRAAGPPAACVSGNSPDRVKESSRHRSNPQRKKASSFRNFHSAQAEWKISGISAARRGHPLEPRPRCREATARGGWRWRSPKEILFLAPSLLSV